MYIYLSQFSAWLSQPFSHLVYTIKFSLLAALVMGILGSVAPCQISANIGAITYFGNRHVQQKLSRLEIFLYILGKIVVYSVFGLLFWSFGQVLSNGSIPLFVYARKLLGPLFVLIGLFFLGWMRLPGNVGNRISDRIYQFSEKVGGKWGSFLMGVAFSIGFCPTMFWLFFGLLMPLVMKSSSGIFLPSIFAIGTTMPLLFFIGIYIGIGLDRVMIKKAKQWGRMIQWAAGILFVLWGISDTVTYWTL